MKDFSKTKFLSMIGLLATLITVTSPLVAQSLAERTMTETPVCRNVKGMFSLCLIDDAMIAKTEIFHLDAPEDYALFSYERMISSAALLDVSDETPGAAQNAFAKIHNIGSQDLQTLDVDTVGHVTTFTYGMMRSQNARLSPVVVTVLKFAHTPLYVASVFPNVFNQAGEAELNTAKLEKHLTLVRALKPLVPD
jgi:hypothetical protein